ncbi:endonuclease III domain-containing protein [Roseomonas sp. CCTCC AB2023176]|uniref:endonuclease III domain-containing protein n=1 Tax=Roseomonas sp. CCTCC AB2023176 TaxID=3342640 RepID=UPI0035D8EAD6
MARATPADRLHERLLEIHRRLCEALGCPIAYFGDLDPLDELVSSLLSHRTRNRDSATAFRTLRGRFPDWNSVRDAPVEDVQAAISACTWPEAKAPALQRTLRAIAERRGALDLQHLADLPVAEAREWLEGLPGVGPKTSAAVLSFSTLRRRALPVDSHHHRVAQRLGLIPGNLSVGPSHRVLEAMLPPEWDAQQVYDHHEVLMLHGQRTCHFHAPACDRCVLLDLCPTGQSRHAAPSVRPDAIRPDAIRPAAGMAPRGP